MKSKKIITSKYFKKSICVLLIDEISVTESLILKSFNKIKIKKIKKIFFIGCKERFKKIYEKTLKYSEKFKFINVNYKLNKYEYLKNITKVAIKLFKENKINYLINMPMNKKKFLNYKFNGYTEFFSKQFDNKKNETMLLFNKNFSVSPVTTHIQIKDIDKNIIKKKIVQNILNINFFYKNIIKKK